MDSFDQFWTAYQKKVGKDKVESKWYRLTAQDHILIMNHVHGFVAKQRNKQYRPNPLSYLNGKMWLNEDITQEETQVYKQPLQPTVSDYKPKEFERSEFIKTFRGKIKAFYESGTPIKDWGGVYTSLLTEKCTMSVPGNVKQLIENKVQEEARTERNRFEEPYQNNVESDIRDQELKWWLENAKAEGIKVYEMI